MKILIIESNYIGIEVGALWKKKGHTVTATTSHAELIEKLSHCSQKSVVLKTDASEELTDLLLSNDFIFIEDKENTQLATHIRKLALKINTPKKIIYLSSSAVYGDHQGKWVDEASELKTTDEYGKDLIETEKTYLSLEELNWQVCILRSAEVYGPGKELSKRVALFSDQVLSGDGSQYSNMVHQLDSTFAVNYALQHNLEGIYNLSDDEHPTRKEIYDKVAEKFQLPKVKWDPTHTPFHEGNKRVSNHKIKMEGFALHHPLRLIT